MKPLISIMIPTTNQGFSHISHLIPTLSIEAKEQNAEIIVIDNGSRDGTTNYLSNYECRIIVNKSNRGFSVANNQAAEIARGEYLLLLNNDTTITPGLLRDMVEVFSIHHTIGIVGCCILTMDEKKVQHAGVCFTVDYVPYELGLEIPSIAPGIPRNDERVGSVREVPSVSAACMMVKKSVWDEIGGLDEAYMNGWEDTDFVLKARERGYKVWYTGKTRIYHKHFGSHGRFAYERENRARYDAIWVHTKRAESALGGKRES